MTTHLDDGNLDDMLEVIGERNVVQEGVRTLIAHGYQSLYIMGKLLKDTSEKYNLTRDNMELFITMRVDVTALSSIEIMNNSKLLNIVSSKAFICFSFLYFHRSLLNMPERSTIATRYRFERRDS